jgi:hypothetical protein
LEAVRAQVVIAVVERDQGKVSAAAVGLIVLQFIGFAVAYVDASGKGELGEVRERTQMLPVLLSLFGISGEGGGPHGKGGLQFGFDGVGGDFVVPEDEDLPFGVVVVPLYAYSGIGVFGESGTGKLEAFFPVLGAGDLGEREEGIL